VVLEKLKLREALLLARRGDHAAAVAAADPLPPERDPGGDARVARACVFGLAAAAASTDARLPGVVRGVLAEYYARCGQRELMKAGEEGYFKDRHKLEYLSADRDLDGLSR
jgi:hypothetical protein